LSEHKSGGSPPAIELRGVRYSVPGRDILRGVDLTVPAGEICCIMGTSGCGKTTLLRTIIGLAQATAGEVLIEGRNIVGLNEFELNQVRKRMGMVFQYAALFDSLTVWENVAFGLLRERKLSRREIDEIVAAKLEAVGMQGVEHLYPAQLSGGMRQRVMIAMALSCNPRLLIADEPTTALDVTIQAQILDLLRDLQEKFNMAVIMITHDIGVIAETARRVVIMYAGQVMEVGDVMDIFHDPRHPYTIGLKASMPRLAKKGRKLSVIPGKVPDLVDSPPGCRFSDRCKFAEYKCDNREITLREVSPGHLVRCWKDVKSESADS